VMSGPHPARERICAGCIASLLLRRSGCSRGARRGLWRARFGAMRCCEETGWARPILPLEGRQGAFVRMGSGFGTETVTRACWREFLRGQPIAAIEGTHGQGSDHATVALTFSRSGKDTRRKALQLDAVSGDCERYGVSRECAGDVWIEARRYCLVRDMQVPLLKPSGGQCCLHSTQGSVRDRF